jgi:hypothetical protein
MSDMHVAFGTAMGAGAPTYPRKPRATETVAMSASAASTTITATAGDYARIAAVGGALYVRVKDTAAAGDDYYLPSGGVIDIGPLKEGDTISGIDA